MANLSSDFLDDDCSSGEDSLLLEETLFTRAPTLFVPVSRESNGSSAGETKSETMVVLEVAQGNTAQMASSNSPPLCKYFAMLALELNTVCTSMVVVVDNAHIPLGAEYLLEDEDACNEAFSRSLSAINTVSFPPPFLIMAEDRGVSSSRWDSSAVQIRRGDSGNSRRLVNQAESDLGPQKPGRTRDDYETEAQSIDKTTHHRFTARNLKSPVPIKKTPRRRVGPMVPSTSRTTTPAALCNKPYNAPGPSKSLDSTSRWLRELPRREDVKPIPPRPRGLVRRRSPGRRYSSEDLEDHVSVTEDERQKREQFRPDTREWTAWFEKMSSMTSALHHDDQGSDLDPGADDGLMNETVHHETTFKCSLETSNLKPSYVDQFASWDEGTSNRRTSTFFRSSQANPSSLVNQLMIIDSGSPTDPYHRVMHSPASHLKSELAKRKNIDLLMGHGSPTDLFDNDKDPDLLSASSHSQRGQTDTVPKWHARAGSCRQAVQKEALVDDT